MNFNVVKGPAGTDSGRFFRDGWAAYGQWVNEAFDPIEGFRGEWTVPAGPRVSGGQTIFFFIGLQNRAYILQPVLQWGTSFAGGGEYWSIANWYTNGRTGQTMVSPCVRVAEGDRLSAGIELVRQEGRDFYYRVYFEGHAGLDLMTGPLVECSYAFAVLEVKGMTDGLYPAQERVVMEELRLRVGGRGVEPGWRTARRRGKALGVSLPMAEVRGMGEISFLMPG